MNSTATANSDDEPLFRSGGSEEQLIADEVRSPVARKRNGRLLRKLIVILLLAAGVAWSAQYIHRLMTHAETDDAFVTGHVHDVSSRIAGTVTEILFEENQEVKAGDVLARLDPADARSKLA
jgi:membrane fusion protein (multidrug efflux system)